MKLGDILKANQLMEKKMNKYPYIGEHMGNVTLFTGKDSGFSIVNSDCEQGHYSEGWGEIGFKNITREYLANTYGEVASPEHAEFIIELAKVNGYKCGNFSKNRDRYFFVEGEWIRFTDSELHASSDDEKQITIPLPPKADPKIYPQDNLGKAPKHFDCVCNKCGGNCCTGQCDWLQVGAEVVTRGGSNGVVKISEQDKDGMIVCDFDGEYALTYKSELSKPKTPEEELREDIEYAIHHFEGDKVAGRKWLMSRYDIKKKDSK